MLTSKDRRVVIQAAVVMEERFSSTAVFSSVDFRGAKTVAVYHGVVG